jgi:hypothetical protein
MPWLREQAVGYLEQGVVTRQVRALARAMNIPKVQVERCMW